MKQRIDIRELGLLSETQKDKLRDLWDPVLNDLAVATACMDAKNDLFREIIFIVGHVKMGASGNLTLFDLRAVDGYHKLTPGEGEYSEDPIAFDKSECLPLLNIGQIIEISWKQSINCESILALGGHELCDNLWTVLVEKL
jgi:hypothetical protein